MKCSIMIPLRDRSSPAISDIEVTNHHLRVDLEVLHAAIQLGLPSPTDSVSPVLPAQSVSAHSPPSVDVMLRLQTTPPSGPLSMKLRCWVGGRQEGSPSVQELTCLSILALLRRGCCCPHLAQHSLTQPALLVLALRNREDCSILRSPTRLPRRGARQCLPS
jgi:hypothetical protein